MATTSTMTPSKSVSKSAVLYSLRRNLDTVQRQLDENRKARPRQSNGGIIRGLSLDAASYGDFYTSVEQLVAQRGWIGNTFRTISEKRSVHNALTVAMQENA